MDEIEFWSEWLGNVEGCERSIKDHLVDLFVQVDTGEHATGGVCKGEAVTIPLPASLIGTSSTLRELHGTIKDERPGWSGDKGVRYDDTTTTNVLLCVCQRSAPSIY
eukprot:g15917.t1